MISMSTTNVNCFWANRTPSSPKKTCNYDSSKWWSTAITFHSSCYHLHHLNTEWEKSISFLSLS